MWILALISPALGATLTVASDGTGQFDTVKAAIDAASDGDEISVGPGTYTQFLDLRFLDLQVTSTDGAETTILDGGGATERLIQTRGNDTLSGFTVRNGSLGGIHSVAPSLTLRDMVFEDLGHSGLTGGSLSLDGGSVNLNDCTFTGGEANLGGHIGAVDADVTCTDCTFEGGQARYGGALYIWGGRLFMNGGLVHGNGVDYYVDTDVYGGAVYVDGAASMTATDTVFTENLAYAGGGLHVGDYARVDLTGVTFDDNEAVYGSAIKTAVGSELALESATLADNGHTDWSSIISYGGAIWLGTSSILSIEDSSLTRNFAYYGGAVYAEYTGPVQLAGATFEQNISYYGGAMYNLYVAELTVSESLFDTNTGYYGGGALYNYVSSLITLSDSTWVDNQALYNVGGAIYQYYPSGFTSTGNTWSGNVSGYAGGALYLYYQHGPLHVEGDTYAQNECTYGAGGAIWAYYQDVAEGDLTVLDTTLEYNTSTQGGAIYANTLDLTLTGSQVHGNAATLYGGGGVWAEYGDLRLDQSELSANAAAAEGGGLGHRSGSTVLLTRSTVSGNESGGAGGGLYLKAPAWLAARNLALLDNDARYGGGLYQAGCAGPDLVWTNLRVQDNAARYGGGLALLECGGTTLENVSLVKNSALDGGSALYLYDTTASLVNSVVAFHTETEALYAHDEASALTTLSYNAMYGNGAGDLAGDWAVGEHLVTSHPMFADFSDDDDSSNDRLIPLQDSPLIDAGDPLIRDADGGPSDLGATGGPQAWLVDDDDDGWSTNLDCHDDDPTAHPGGEETWYDGINGDCLGLSDYDQDGDGHDAVDHEGDDCADRDPNVWNTCPDGSGNETPIDPEPEEESGSCTTAPGPIGAVWFLAGLVGLGRRRR